MPRRLLIPAWLHYTSIGFLAAGVICAVVIAVDVWRYPQQMWIMDVVWPVTALFGTILVLAQYFNYGRLATRQEARSAKQQKRAPRTSAFLPLR